LDLPGSEPEPGDEASDLEREMIEQSQEGDEA
jgi:hypothetical protein